jgi:hypothetical protein
MRRVRRLWECAALVLVGSPAWAEDDRVIEEPPTPQAQGEQQHLIDLGTNFDANLFEQQGNGWVLRGNANVVMPHGQLILNGRRMILPGGIAVAEEQSPESPTFSRARILGEKRLERIAASCDLTDPQRRKLRLAMESDIRRFAAVVDGHRHRHRATILSTGENESARANFLEWPGRPGCSSSRTGHWQAGPARGRASRCQMPSGLGTGMAASITWTWKWGHCA